ncbi:MAG TPA: hypothetical protein VGB64_09800 [Actinomycetota bacterium]
MIGTPRGIVAAGLLLAFIGGVASPDAVVAHESHTVSDEAGTNELPEPIATATMEDVLATATLLQAGSRCSYVTRDTRVGGADVPPDRREWQLYYFVPKDIAVRDWDRAVMCTDARTGKRTLHESNIGASAYNTQAWMASRTASGPSQGHRVRGKAFRIGVRTIAGWGPVRLVSAIVGAQPDAYYSTNSAARLIAEMNQRGFGHGLPKYMIFADVRSDRNSAGIAEYGGNQAIMYRRFTIGGRGYAARWGCADQGDKTTIHEAIHTFGNVQPTAAENSSKTSNPHHVLQSADAMNYRGGGSTFRGRYADGTYSPVSIWDADADSYTSRVLSFASYLIPFGTGYPLRTYCGSYVA